MYQGDILGFVNLLGKIHLDKNKGLEKAAQLVEDTAKAELGIYQPAKGPYVAWEPLADSTEERKARAGAPANSPLIREGDMLDAFSHRVEGHKATIENSDHAAIVQEMGGGHTPPRPFLAPALFVKTDEIKKILGGDFVAGFTHPL